MYPNSPPVSEPAPAPTQTVALQIPGPTKPLVTRTILGITILVFLAQLVSEYTAGIDWPLYYGAKNNLLISMGEWWRLVTPMLLHGGIIHIGFNMYALNVIGPELERYFGHWRFLVLYLLGGFAGNVVSMLLTPGLSVGSSTAIFGLIGAQGAFIYLNRQLMGPRAKKALMGVVQIAGINFLIGLTPGIDNWGHLGGMLGGLIFSLLGGPVFRPEGLYPVIRLVDTRETQQTVAAAGGVLLIFAALAAAAIYFQ